MASYSEKDIDTQISPDDEFEWTPPTEAEMKIIQARRERSDKISKIMGSYLLKGYKMLATECPKCGSIELQDKHQKVYCVACEEVDTDTQKDNPALSEKAATSKRAEQQFSSDKNKIEKPWDLEYERASTELASAFSALLTESISVEPNRNEQRCQPVSLTESNSLEPNRNEQRSQPVSLHQPKGISNNALHNRILEECTKCLEVTLNKLSWARLLLEAETDPVMTVSYLKVITNCVEAIPVLQRFSN